MPAATRSSEHVRIGPVPFILVAVLILGAVGIGATLWPSPRDEWARLIEDGDALAGGGETARGRTDGLTARSAYLLAFHHAQDALDVARMLLAADRLERLGERDLAAHVRHVAGTVAGAGTTGDSRGRATSR